MAHVGEERGLRAIDLRQRVGPLAFLFVGTRVRAGIGAAVVAAATVLVAATATLSALGLLLAALLTATLLATALLATLLTLLAALLTLALLLTALLATLLAGHAGAQVTFEVDGVLSFAATGETVNAGGTQITFTAAPSGAIPGDRFIQVGLRGYWPGEEDQKWMRDNGLTHFMMQEFWERGTKEVMRDVIETAQKKAPHVYISIDIDVLDPGFAPATGTPFGMHSGARPHVARAIPSSRDEGTTSAAAAARPRRR